MYHGLETEKREWRCSSIYFIANGPLFIQSRFLGVSINIYCYCADLGCISTPTGDSGGVTTLVSSADAFHYNLFGLYASSS